MRRSRSHYTGITNPKFRPRLKKRPSVTYYDSSGRQTGIYLYCPNSLTAHPELEKGKTVYLAEIPEDKNDPSVVVHTRPTGHSEKRYRVFWTDLRP